MHLANSNYNNSSLGYKHYERILSLIYPADEKDKEVSSKDAANTENDKVEPSCSDRFLARH